MSTHWWSMEWQVQGLMIGLRSMQRKYYSNFRLHLCMQLCAYAYGKLAIILRDHFDPWLQGGSWHILLANGHWFSWFSHSNSFHVANMFRGTGGGSLITTDSLTSPYHWRNHHAYAYACAIVEKVLIYIVWKKHTYNLTTSGFQSTTIWSWFWSAGFECEGSQRDIHIYI